MQPTWQALIDGARYCEPQLREIIARQRPDVIVEDNVVAFPALDDRRARRSSGSCRATRSRCRGPDVPPAYSGLPVRRPRPSGTRSARSTTGPTARRGRRSTSGAASRARRALPDLEFIHASRAPEPLRLPAGRRLHRPPAARRDVAPPRLVRPARPTPRSSCPALADGPAGRLGARSTCRSGSLGSRRRRADAAARRRPRRHAAPLHRLEGPAARRVRARRQHVGRRVPAPDEARSRSSTS